MSKMSLLIAVTILFGSLVIATPLAYLNYATPPPVNSPPVAVADNYTFHGNGNAGSVLVNDYDPDPGQSISATILRFPLTVLLATMAMATFHTNGTVQRGPARIASPTRFAIPAPQLSVLPQPR